MTRLKSLIRISVLMAMASSTTDAAPTSEPVSNIAVTNAQARPDNMPAPDRPASQPTTVSASETSAVAKSVPLQEPETGPQQADERQEQAGRDDDGN